MRLDQLPATLTIGEGRSLEFFTSGSDDVIGAFETHPCASDHAGHKQGEPCTGGIYFDVPECQATTKWQVLSWEPLTLSPSILCSCGNHGFIRDGEWVPA